MKGKIISFGILLVLLLGAGLAVNQIKTSSKPTLSAATHDYANTTVKVGSKTFAVELGLTSDQQALGLGKRDALAPSAGMLFVFKPAQIATFWMKDMRFPLDMVWINNGRVIGISRNVPVPPAGTTTAKLPTYSPNALVDYVLEVNAGQADNVSIGDQFQVVDSQAV